MNDKLLPAPIDWLPLLPILFVFGTGVAAMIIEMLWPRRSNYLIVGTTIVGLVAAAYTVTLNWDFSGTTLGGLFTNDRFGQVTQLLLIVIALLTCLYSEGYLREKRVAFGEYYSLVLWSTVGGMIMATTHDLLIMFLGLEVLSIALYVLAGLSSKEKRSQESALKYFLLGAFASGFLLYGISLVYGATGSTNASAVSQLLQMRSGVDVNNIRMLYAGLGLLLVGFGFKAAIVPFHMWTPDVYQGAPTTVTGFMAAGSKVAAIAALFRFLEYSIGMAAIWIPLLMMLGVLTMTVGNLIALVQTDVKRILGYSSIAHAGYLLVAIAALGSLRATGAPIGEQTIMYYLIAYSVMTVGAFAVLSLAARNGNEGTRLEDFHGLWKSAPFVAGTMIVFMWSLAGLPPMAGFFGKYMIFTDLVDAGMLSIALILAINSVLSAFYYVKIVLAIVVNEPDLRPATFARASSGLITVTGLCALLVIGLGIALGPVTEWMGLAPPTEQTNALYGAKP
ncbi:MAG: NADH-quinone oxidoreductase subunit N [Armatimonadota bacterium]|nr:NADH-quinone oxidoreductase subunit N [Armatimonadota bacterium]